MPKRIYFPADWCRFDCEDWLNERKLPIRWFLVERDRGYVWMNDPVCE